MSFSLTSVVAHYLRTLAADQGRDFSEAEAEMSGYEETWNERLAALEARVADLEAQNKAMHLGAQQRGRVGK